MCPDNLLPRRRSARAFVVPSDLPPGPERRIAGGIVLTTMADWYANGVDLVRDGARGVSITDRSPVVTESAAPSRGAAFEYHGSGAGRVEAFGWQYGFAWLLNPAEHQFAYWTLPQDVFAHLPDCQFPQIVLARSRGSGCMPLWLTPGGAMAALNVAAFAWALAVA